MDERQLGELIGTVRAIKENTDKIPNMTVALAEHQLRINAMEPKVERHENANQRAVGIASMFGVISGIAATFLRNLSNGGS